jgi:hypothetical protein
LISAPRLLTRYPHHRLDPYVASAPKVPHPTDAPPSAIDALPAPPTRSLRRLCPKGSASYRCTSVVPAPMDSTNASFLFCTPRATRLAAPTAFPMQHLVPPTLSASSASAPVGSGSPVSAVSQARALVTEVSSRFSRFVLRLGS